MHAIAINQNDIFIKNKIALMFEHRHIIVSVYHGTVYNTPYHYVVA